MWKQAARKILWGGGGRARPLFFFSLLFAAVVFLASWFKEDGIKSVFEYDHKLAADVEGLKKIQADNEALREKIRSVREGSYLMEKYAREKLLMARQGEVVFRFHEGSATAEKRP